MSSNDCYFNSNQQQQHDYTIEQFSYSAAVSSLTSANIDGIEFPLKINNNEEEFPSFSINYYYYYLKIKYNNIIIH